MLETLRSTTNSIRVLLKEDFTNEGKGLSQAELATQLGLDRGTISRALRRLRTAAEVKIHRDHVTGQKYRVLVYQLTWAGRTRIQHARPAPFRDLPPVGDLFVGRTQELAQIRRGIARGGIVIVDGVPGVGKSTLVRRAVNSVSSSHLMIWTQLQQGTPPGALWDQLSRAEGGTQSPSRSDPTSVLPPAPQLSSAPVVAYLDRHPKGVLWVFDDVQSASAATQDALREVLSAFRPGTRHVAFVITQRELPWPVPNGAAAHITLRGLPRRDALGLTSALGVSEDRFEALFRETLGMPRYLRLASRVGVGEGSTFASAVLNSLPAHQRAALVPLALSWTPLPLRSGLLPGLTPDEVDGLVSLSILDRSEAGLELPEPVARRLTETASWEEVEGAHRFLAMSTLLAPAERFFHATEGEEPAMALAILRAHRNELIVASDPRVLRAALRLANVIPAGRRRGNLFLLIAEIQRTLGDFVAASTFLERAFEQLRHDDPAAVHAAAILSLTSLRAGHAEQAEHWASLLRGLGNDHRWSAVAALARGNVRTYRGDLEKGETFLLEAERLARRHRQPEIRIMALHALAFIRFRAGKYEQAIDVAQEGFLLSSERHREDFERIFELVIHQVEYKQGKREVAIAGFRRILDLARRAGDRTRVATVLANLSIAAGHRGDLPQAIDLARQSVREAEAAQDVSNTAMAYSWLAWWLKMDGRSDEAKTLAQRARRLSREVGPSPSSSVVQALWRDFRDSGAPLDPSQGVGAPWARLAQLRHTARP